MSSFDDLCRRSQAEFSRLQAESDLAASFILIEASAAAAGVETSTVDEIAGGIGGTVDETAGGIGDGTADETAGGIGTSTVASEHCVGDEPPADGDDFGGGWHEHGDSGYKPGRYTMEELLDLRAETAAAKELNIPWQKRGPPGPDQGGPQTWRNQPYRPISGKWAKRGGQWKDYYHAKYGKNTSKTKGKGKGKSNRGPDPHVVWRLWKDGNFPPYGGSGGCGGGVCA
jgi:hypothetical protein